MSVKILSNVWDLGLPTSEKLLLLALAHHLQQSGIYSLPDQVLLETLTGHNHRICFDLSKPKASSSRREFTAMDNYSPHNYAFSQMHKDFNLSEAYANHLRRIRESVPHLTIESVRTNQDGLTNDILIINYQLVFRFPKNEM